MKKEKATEIEVSRIEDDIFVAEFPSSSPLVGSIYSVIFQVLVDDTANICYVTERIDGVYVSIDDRKVEKEVKTVIDRYLRENGTDNMYTAA